MSESLHQRSLITCILTRREFEASCFCEISCFAFPDLDDRSLAFPLSTCAKVGWGVGGGFEKVCLCGQRMLKMCRNGEGWIIVGRRGRGGAVWYLHSRWTSELQVSQTGLRMPPSPPVHFRLHTPGDPLYLGISGRAMKGSDRRLRVRRPGREPSDKRSPGLLLGFRSI